MNVRKSNYRVIAPDTLREYKQTISWTEFFTSLAIKYPCYIQSPLISPKMFAWNYLLTTLQRIWMCTKTKRKTVFSFEFLILKASKKTFAIHMHTVKVLLATSESKLEWWFCLETLFSFMFISLYAISAYRNRLKVFGEFRKSPEENANLKTGT